jgi:hypothetical protein
MIPFTTTDTAHAAVICGVWVLLLALLALGAHAAAKRER